MNNLMLTVLSLSLAGSIIIAFLFLCKPLYKERLSKKWQYYIWLVVIARLIVPFSFELNIVGGLFNEITQRNAPSIIASEPINSVIGSGEANITGVDNEVPIITNTPNIQNVVPDLQTTIPEAQTPAPYSQSDIFNVLISYSWLIWIVVAVILFIRKVTIYQSFVNYIKVGRIPLENMADLERFGKLVEQSNIKRMVGIYTNSLVSSPLLIGFFKPYIVLPTTDISEVDFKHTIMHELTHYKRGDMFYKWLVQLTICLHWFNPLVYLMGREINNACEFSCDESVIKRLDLQEIKAYGNTLLNALGIGGEYKNALSTITLSENKKILGERLNMIKNFRKKSKSAVICAVLFTMVLSMGAGVVGVYGVTNNSVPTLNEAESEILEREREINFTPRPITSARELEQAYEIMEILAEKTRVLGAEMSSIGRQMQSGNWQELMAVMEDLGEEMTRWGEVVSAWGDEVTAFIARHPVSRQDANAIVREHLGVVSNERPLWRLGSSYSFVARNNRAVWRIDYPVHGTFFVDATTGEILRYESNEIPVISGDFEVSIPFIAAGEEVLIGRLNLEQGQVYEASILAAEGNSVFVGVRNVIIQESGGMVAWRPFSSNGNLGSHTTVITHLGEPYVYFFAGSTPFGINTSDLTDVTVRLTMLSEAPLPPTMPAPILPPTPIPIPMPTPPIPTPIPSMQTPPQISVPSVEIPVINGDLELHIPFIAVGDEVLVGQLNLEQGQMYKVSIEAAEGISVFVGVRIYSTPTSQPSYFVGAESFWSPFSSRGNAGSVTETITHCGRLAYLVVGSSRFSSFATDLTDVIVRVTMLQE